MQARAALGASRHGPTSPWPHESAGGMRARTKDMQGLEAMFPNGCTVAVDLSSRSDIHVPERGQRSCKKLITACTQPAPFFGSHTGKTDGFAPRWPRRKPQLGASWTPRISASSLLPALSSTMSSSRAQKASPSQTP